jgi:hypothetical protein
MARKIKVGLVEPVEIMGKKKVRVLGKFDTGAHRTSIDRKIADELDLKKIGTTTVENVHGKSKRPLVEVKLKIKNKTLKIQANVANRTSRRFKILLGRNAIYNNFIIDITKSHKSMKVEDLNESLRNWGKR